MAKKRGKVFRRQADRSWKELKPRKPKQRRKAPPKPTQASRRKAKQKAEAAGLRMLIRAAAKTGAAEAIEHCANFWSVSDGYKKYIDYQIKSQAEELMVAVTTVIRTELSPFRRQIAHAERRRKQRP